MKERIFIWLVFLLSVSVLSGCWSRYEYYACLSIHSDVYNSWDATDTVWLRFVGHKHVPAYLGVPQEEYYYRSDSNSLIIYNYNAEYGIDTMSCTEFRRLASDSDGETTPSIIQCKEVSSKYILSSTDFQNVLACDTILLYINEEQLACWTPDNIPETYKNIFDYQTAWFYYTNQDASFVLDKSDIRELREMKHNQHNITTP